MCIYLYTYIHIWTYFFFLKNIFALLFFDVYTRLFGLRPMQLSSLTSVLRLKTRCGSSSRVSLNSSLLSVPMKRLPGKRRSVGSKKEPTCSVCHSRKHYGSSCPKLAQKLLQAVRRKSGLQSIVTAVEERSVLTVLEAKKKPKKTLKRRARGNAALAKKCRQTGSKTRKKKGSQKANAVRDKARTPRATKKIAAESLTGKQTKQAYTALMKAKWLWKPGTCPCGGRLLLCRQATNRLRGAGRCFYRCTDCEGKGHA